MRKPPRYSFAVLVFAFLLSLAASNASSEEVDLTVTALDYTNDFEGGEPVTVVQNGRDNDTLFRYLILDDYSEAPEDWTQLGFNDSSWFIGAAPFGDREYNNVNPNTIWDTTGSDPYEADVLLVRHKFQTPAGTILSAEIDMAFTNYYLHVETKRISRARQGELTMCNTDNAIARQLPTQGLKLPL